MRTDETICLNSKVNGVQPSLADRIYYGGGYFYCYNSSEPRKKKPVGICTGTRALGSNAGKFRGWTSAESVPRFQHSFTRICPSAKSMKPILIISGDFGVREVYDTDDTLPEFNTNETENLPDRQDMEIRGEWLGLP